MDPKPTEDARLQELIRISNTSRRHLGHQVTGLRRKLDLPLRIRDALGQKPTQLLLGSLGAGLLTSLIFKRRPEPGERKPRGFSRSLIALTLTAARPLAKVWLTGKLKSLASEMLTRGVQAASPFKVKNDPPQSNGSSSGSGPR